MSEQDSTKRYQLTEHEADVVRYIYEQRTLSHFALALYHAIFHADNSNLERLSLGFPGEVEALRAWRHGDLRERAEGAGLIGGAVGVA